MGELGGSRGAQRRQQQVFHPHGGVPQGQQVMQELAAVHRQQQGLPADGIPVVRGRRPCVDPQLHHRREHRRHHRPVEQHAHGVVQRPPQAQRALTDPQALHGAAGFRPVAAAVETQHRQQGGKAHGTGDGCAGLTGQLAEIDQLILRRFCTVRRYDDGVRLLRRYQPQQCAGQYRCQQRDS